MTEFVIKKDYWTLMVVFAGILIFAGIVSTAGSLVENIGATDTTTNTGEGGIGGADTGTNIVPVDRDSTGETIGYPRIYYPVGEIPDKIYIGGNIETPILTLEDFEIEDELIKFTIVHHMGRTNGLDIEVEYLNCEDRSFFKTYRVNIEKLEENEERKQEFGQLLANSRHINNDEPLVIKGVEIKYKWA